VEKAYSTVARYGCVLIDSISLQDMFDMLPPTEKLRILKRYTRRLKDYIRKREKDVPETARKLRETLEKSMI